MTLLMLGGFEHDYADEVEQLAAEFKRIGFSVDPNLIAVLYLMDAGQAVNEATPFEWCGGVELQCIRLMRYLRPIPLSRVAMIDAGVPGGSFTAIQDERRRHGD